MAYIEMRGIQKCYGKQEVLKNVNIEIEKGQLVTLLGPSGCGKSTLLRCLAGLEDIAAGEIYMDGENITNKNPKKRGIGMVFQQYSLFPNMTVEQNIAFGLKMQKAGKELIRKKVEKAIDLVGLGERKDYYPSQLSGGQQQRAALARAIVTEPKVLLLDEPLSAIDALLRHSLQVEIKRIQKELGITAIFVTHDQNEAMIMSDRIVVMNRGEIAQAATPDVLYTHPENEFVASFVGHYNIVTAETMLTCFGKQVCAEKIAFRPETVVIEKLQMADNTADATCGIVTDVMLHGNFVRYSIRAGETSIDVDQLFDGAAGILVGDKVCLTIEDRDMVVIA